MPTHFYCMTNISGIIAIKSPKQLPLTANRTTQSTQCVLASRNDQPLRRSAMRSRSRRSIEAVRSVLAYLWTQTTFMTACFGAATYVFVRSATAFDGQSSQSAALSRTCACPAQVQSRDDLVDRSDQTVRFSMASHLLILVVRLNFN